MKNKSITLAITSLTAILLGAGVFVNASVNKEVKNVQALDSNNVLYLNFENCSTFYDQYILASVVDDDHNSFTSVMKPVENTSNRIYRLTLPTDHEYKYATFFAKEDLGLDLTSAETNSVNIPTNTNNVYVLDSGEWYGFVYHCTGHWSYYEDDIPSDGEGYYLVGSETGNKFKNSVKLGEATHGDKAELLNYAAKAGETLNVKSFFDDEVKTYRETNYEVGESDVALNIFVDQDDKMVVDNYVTPPEFEGFYISGTFSTVEKWTYYDSIKMSDVEGDYIAEYRGLEVKLGDQIRVRKFAYDSHPWETWSLVSESQDVSTFGQISGDNFEFTLSGNYDVFVKIENEQYVFLVFEHAEAFTVELTCLYYDGATKADMEFAPAQTAYAGSEFEPVAPNKEHKYYIGAYKDEACLYPYSKEEITTNCHLYLKYCNENYYLFVGKNVAGTYDKQYIFDTGIKMNNIDRPEGVQADIYKKVNAEDRYMVGLFTSSGWVAPAAGSDILPPYVEYDYAGKQYNYIFHKAGTYHIVFNSNNRLEIFDADGEPFCNDVISSIEIDNKNHVSTSLETLKSKWNNHKDKFNAIEDKKAFNDIGFKYTENPANIFEEFINKYYLAIYRYGSDELENYMFLDHEKVEPHPYTCIVTFNVDGGTLEETTKEVVEGESIALPSPTKEGFTFLGWTLLGNEEYLTSPYVVNEDVTLLAHYAFNNKDDGNNKDDSSTKKIDNTVLIVSVSAGSVVVGGSLVAGLLLRKKRRVK